MQCTVFGIYKPGDSPKGRPWAETLKVHIGHCQEAESSDWQAKVRAAAISDDQIAEFETFLSNLPSVKRALKRAVQSKQ